MKNKKLTKTQSCRIHFKKRVQERFGVCINRKDIASLVRDIINEDNVFFHTKLTNRVELYDMVFCKKRMKIIFDKKRQVPVTALTTDMNTTKFGDL